MRTGVVDQQADIFRAPCPRQSLREGAHAGGIAEVQLAALAAARKPPARVAGTGHSAQPSPGPFPGATAFMCGVWGLTAPPAPPWPLRIAPSFCSQGSRARPWPSALPRPPCRSHCCRPSRRRYLRRCHALAAPSKPRARNILRPSNEYTAARLGGRGLGRAAARHDPRSTSPRGGAGRGDAARRLASPAHGFHGRMKQRSGRPP